MLDLDALDAPGAGPGADAAAGQGRGQPLQIAPDLIDEDPAQPRREFDAAALQELAATIAARGVRQPVSVRPHPAAAGRWSRISTGYGFNCSRAICRISAG